MLGSKSRQVACPGGKGAPGGPGRESLTSLSLEETAQPPGLCRKVPGLAIHGLVETPVMVSKCLDMKHLIGCHYTGSCPVRGESASVQETEVSLTILCC